MARTSFDFFYFNLNKKNNNNNKRHRISLCRQDWSGTQRPICLLGAGITGVYYHARPSPNVLSELVICAAVVAIRSHMLVTAAVGRCAESTPRLQRS